MFRQVISFDAAGRQSVTMTPIIGADWGESGLPVSSRPCDGSRLAAVFRLASARGRTGVARPRSCYRGVKGPQ